MQFLTRLVPVTVAASLLHRGMKGIVGLTACILLCGCGGNCVASSATARLPLGFYRGTMVFEDAPGVTAGVAPIALSVQPNGDFEGFAVSASVSGDVGKVGATGFFRHGFISWGDVTVSATATGSTLNFTVHNGATLLASGSVERAELPAYGSATLTPPSGTYVGELTVLSGGVAKGFGTVEATIDESGNWLAITLGGGAWLQGALGMATVLPDGVLQNALLSSSGIIYQSPPVLYSYDGTRLVMRFDSLFLEPGSCWFVMALNHD